MKVKSKLQRIGSNPPLPAITTTLLIDSGRTSFWLRIVGMLRRRVTSDPDLIEQTSTDIASIETSVNNALYPSKTINTVKPVSKDPRSG